ncbi:MAG: hypothetical protein HUU14_06975, partial [Dehalococcoidia bacterium]|nr:hypothetical protein [Dehalococcoidia bacterium]
FPVFDAGFCRFGALICADGRQPEIARSLAVNGAHGVRHVRTHFGELAGWLPLPEHRRPVLMPLAGRGGVATLRVALHFAEQLEEKIVVPGSLLVAATGGGLILSDVSGYQDDLPAWIVVSIALWVAAAVIAFTVQNPAVKRALAVLEGAADNGPVPQAMGPIAGRLDRVGKVLALLAILSLFLMTWRPGLW